MLSESAWVSVKVSFSTGIVCWSLYTKAIMSKSLCAIPASCEVWLLYVQLDDIMLHRFPLPRVRCCRNTLILNPPMFHYYCTKHSVDTTLQSHTFKISLWVLHNCDFVMRVYELAQLRRMIRMCNNYIWLHTSFFFPMQTKPRLQ